MSNKNFTFAKTVKEMTQIILTIENPDIIPSLKKVLGQINGVTISKTKKVVDLLGNVGATKALIVTSEINENVYKSARNIEDVKASYVGELNVYELLKYDSLVISQDAVKKLEEVYAI